METQSNEKLADVEIGLAALKKVSSWVSDERASNHYIQKDIWDAVHAFQRIGERAKADLADGEGVSKAEIATPQTAAQDALDQLEECYDRSKYVKQAATHVKSGWVDRHRETISRALAMAKVTEDLVIPALRKACDVKHFMPINEDGAGLYYQGKLSYVQDRLDNALHAYEAALSEKGVG